MVSAEKSIRNAISRSEQLGFAFLFDLAADEVRGEAAAVAEEERASPVLLAVHVLALVGEEALVERYGTVSFPDFSPKPSNFRGLVLGCIGTDFCN